MTPHFSKYSTIHKTKTFVTFNFARIPQNRGRWADKKYENPKGDCDECFNFIVREIIYLNLFFNYLKI